VLSISNLDVSIASVHILRAVSLELPAGSMTGLIGRNGAGKTTLIKTVMGLLKAGSGSVRFEERDLLAVPTHARARLGIGYMPEDRRLIPDLTVKRTSCCPLGRRGSAMRAPAGKRFWSTSPRSASSRRAKARSFPAASRSSRPWRARSCAAPGCFCWTSRSRAWRRRSRSASPRWCAASRMRA